MVAQATGIRPRTQQTMQRGGRRNRGRQLIFVQHAAEHRCQCFQRTINRLLQTRCRFTGWRRQCNTELVRMLLQSQQQTKQTRHGIGFACTGAAGNHTETATQR